MEVNEALKDAASENGFLWPQRRSRKIRTTLESIRHRHRERALMLIRVHAVSARVCFNFAFVFEHFRTSPDDTPGEVWRSAVGFIFRTIFWLGLALVALPPEARLGGGGNTAEFRNVDVALELKNAADTVWSSAAQIMSTCETNPQLCKAGADLVNTSLAAATDVAQDVAAQLVSEPHTTLAPAESRKPKSKKIQARVE